MAYKFVSIDILRHIWSMYFSAIIIRDLIEYATLHGANVKKLEKEFPDLKEEKYVSYNTVVKTLSHISKELNDEYLGLHVGEQISLKVTAPVDQIMLHSNTLEASINNAIKYSKLISDALECSFKRTEKYFSVVYEENPNWKVQQAHAKKQILDITLLSNVKSLIVYTNYRHYPVCVKFSYEKPKKLQEYYRLFNCTLKFNQPKSEVVYEKQILGRHSKNIKYGLLESLKEKVAEEIENLPSENDLIYQLKKCILNHKPKRVLVEDVSKELNVSSRTLQRKLTELNTTFKKVESELQLKLAKTYLEEKQKSIDEISYLLGFSESSAFIRFFKSLTSQTPMKYKNSLA